MINISEILADLQQKRDELHLQMHLASKDAEDEWKDLVKQWEHFLSVAQFEKSSDEVGEAAKQLGLRMKDAYDRFKSAAS